VLTQTDKRGSHPYMMPMRILYVAVPLFALLAFSVWFAAVAWGRLGQGRRKGLRLVLGRI